MIYPPKGHGVTPRLQREWRRRLRESGFNDLESPNGELRGPKLPRGDRRRSWMAASPIERAAIREYFQACEKFQGQPAYFRMRPEQRLIWRLHTQGLSNSNVVKESGQTMRLVRVTIERGRVAAGLPRTTSTLGRRKLT